KPPEPLALPSTTFADPNATKPAEGHPGWYDTLVVVFRVVALIALVAGAAALAWVALRFRRKRPAKDESFVTSGAGGLGEDLRSLWGSMFRRGERVQGAAGLGMTRL